MRIMKEVSVGGKKKRFFGAARTMKSEEYEGLPLDAKAALIQALIPLGLIFVNDLLQEEVNSLAGKRYQRGETPKPCVRHGSNPGSVRLAGQRSPIRLPRVRDRQNNKEVSLKTPDLLEGQGNFDELLFRRVLYGLSCRNYEDAAMQVPGAIGLSQASVSRKFIEVSAKKLRLFQERDLSSFDLAALWLDGKHFAEDELVAALGLTQDGRKIPLGFVQTGSENSQAISDFLRSLLDRGLNIEAGLLVVIDGSKGFRAAVEKVFSKKALVQRCQWHKRENVVSYLPKSEQEAMRRRLQRAYERPTYSEAKRALETILNELRETNLSAAGSLEEGFEETLTLHRLGVFPLVGISLKTTNCIESLLSQVERNCRKVSRWRNSSQKHRWMAACLLDIEPRLRRVKGHQNLPQLRQALQKELKIQEVKAVA